MIETVSPGVSRFARRDASGWTVDMITVDLGDGALLYSPTSFGEQTRALVEPIGTPRVLVAPNHYHHLSLTKLGALWPEAVKVASDGARPRIEKQGHRGVRALAEATLPAHVRLLPVPGTKNGEVWLFVDDTLVVCDSFFNVVEGVRGAVGLVHRALRTSPGLSLGRTFMWVGVGDRAVYRKWVLDTLSHEKPKVIAFSHGDPLRDADGWKRCTELVDRHLG